MEEYYDKLLALLFTGDPNNIDLVRLIISQIPTKRKKKEMCDKLVDYIIYKHPKAKAEVKIPR